MHGWLAIDKPVGLGSTDLVSKVKRALREGGYPKLKVGHGGTLDPLASGVLPVALGEATKLAGRMLDSDKVYEFAIRFGEETDTLDAEGVVVATSDVRPTPEQIQAVLKRFTGEIEQVPPAYSALKVEGKRAYDLARAGAEVELRSRRVTVHNLRSSPFRGGTGGDHPRRPGLQGHLHTLARPRHCPRPGDGGPCRHVEAAQGRAVHPRIRDFAGQNGGTR